MRKLVSLGVGCEVAFQLRQHSGDATAHYFDWLATPAHGLLHVIEHDFPAFEPRDLSLQHDKGSKAGVLHSKTGIVFHHQFPRRGKVIPEDFINDYPAFAAKFEYLAARFRRTVRAGPVCFVRRDIAEPQALRLEAAMRRLFPEADIRFLYLNGAPAFSTPLGRSIVVSPNKVGFGDSLAWARLLVEQRLAERPFRLASSQIVGASPENRLGEDKVQSAAILAEAHKINPENPWFLYELGRRALAARRFRRAAAFADRALEREPECLDFISLKLRAGLRARLAPAGTALAQILTLIDRAPRSDFYEMAADLMLADGELRQTLVLLDRGLERFPHSDELHLRKARTLFAARSLTEANAAADAALRLHPSGKAYVELKAKVLCALGRDGEAHSLVKETLRAKRSYRLQILRGILALRLGRIYRRTPAAAAEPQPG